MCYELFHYVTLAKNYHALSKTSSCNYCDSNSENSYAEMSSKIFMPFAHTKSNDMHIIILILKWYLKSCYQTMLFLLISLLSIN